MFKLSADIEKKKEKKEMKRKKKKQIIGCFIAWNKHEYLEDRLGSCFEIILKNIWTSHERAEKSKF